MDYLNDSRGAPSTKSPAEPRRHTDGRLSILRRRARAHARSARDRQRVRLGHAQDAPHPASRTTTGLRREADLPSLRHSRCSSSVVFALGSLSSYAIASGKTGRTSTCRRPGCSSARSRPAGSSSPSGPRSVCCSAVFFRGTALATGVGILYAFVIEGLLDALATQVSVLDQLRRALSSARAGTRRRPAGRLVR